MFAAFITDYSTILLDESQYLACTALCSVADAILDRDLEALKQFAGIRQVDPLPSEVILENANRRLAALERKLRPDEEEHPMINPDDHRPGCGCYHCRLGRREQIFPRTGRNAG